MTRFGKFERQAEPGLHLKPPRRRAHLPGAQRQLKQEFGFETANDVNSEYKITKNARARPPCSPAISTATVE